MKLFKYKSIDNLWHILDIVLMKRLFWRVGRDSCKIRQREVNFLKIMPIYKFNKRYFY